MDWLLSLYVVCYFLSSVNGITTCGTKNPTEEDRMDAREMVKEWKERIDETKISNRPIIIDTIWHRVISGGLGNSDNDVTKSMEVLNKAFETHFEFRLIKSHNSTDPHYWDIPSYDDGGMRMHLHEGGCSVLNIYSTKTNIAGFAEFPRRCKYNERMDGVIISYDTVPGGANKEWNGGGTLVHEVGHWLGLFHTFEGGCSENGDKIWDTPAQARPNNGCPRGTDSCPHKKGVDPIHNYMDYTNDTCRDSFTSGQFMIMKANYKRFRPQEEKLPTTSPSNVPTGVTNEPTRNYEGKQFTTTDGLKEQVKTYCDDPASYNSTLYGAIEDWDVSQITAMDYLFFDGPGYNIGVRSTCNPDVGRWDVSRVVRFSFMFWYTKFNQNIGDWDVSNGDRFGGMFSDSDFNQDISSWDVSKASSFGIMFTGTPFNQDISSWDTSKTMQFGSMFSGSLFNRDISSWDVSSGVFFTSMFYNATFNQDISSWDVSNGKTFMHMFARASLFNEDISNWKLTAGTNFLSMLEDASSFNQNLNPWLEWIDKDGNMNNHWCDGAICDRTTLSPSTMPSESPTLITCIALDEADCSKTDGFCEYNTKKKVWGDCTYKNKTFKHDCAQYTSSVLCLSQALSQAHAGVCKWSGNVCSHECDALDKKTCKKKKLLSYDIKLCNMRKIDNPCLGCCPKSK